MDLNSLEQEIHFHLCAPHQVLKTTPYVYLLDAYYNYLDDFYALLSPSLERELLSADLSNQPYHIQTSKLRFYWLQQLHHLYQPISTLPELLQKVFRINFSLNPSLFF